MSKIPFLWQKHLGNRRGLGHLLSYSNIGKNRQNTFICFEDAGRNALTHGQIRPKDRGKLIVFQNVWFSGPELSLVMASFASSFFCSMWLQLLYLQFSNIWLRFWDMEAKFILQPVHQVRPRCGHKYIQVLPVNWVEDDDGDNLELRGGTKGFGRVWSMTKFVIWLAGVNNSIETPAAKNQFNFCWNLLHKELGQLLFGWFTLNYIHQFLSSSSSSSIPPIQPWKR